MTVIACCSGHAAVLVVVASVIQFIALNAQLLLLCVHLYTHRHHKYEGCALS
jgi:hypothetical protein